MKGMMRGARVLGVLLLLGIAACGILRQLGWGEPARPFSHLQHGKEAELECESCHTKADKAAEAGMPASLKSCMMCHEGIDEQRKPEQKLAALVGEKPQWTNVTALPKDVTFSHQVHGEKEVACAECHAGIETSEGITEEVRVVKDACMKCHAERGAPNDCATCHKEIRKETPPKSHEKDWRRSHGGIAQAARLGVTASSQDRCNLCHTEAGCVQCHQEEPPRNHTNFWRLQGHAVQASTDRSRCETCHRSDFCDRCHQETTPRSHVGLWRSPQNRHCLSCHEPLASNPSCNVCHRGERHESAPPRPANAQHAAATENECRTCHEVIGLPHRDNGDSCGSCH